MQVHFPLPKCSVTFDNVAVEQSRRKFVFRRHMQMPTFLYATIYKQQHSLSLFSVMCIIGVLHGFDLNETWKLRNFE